MKCSVFPVFSVPLFFAIIIFAFLSSVYSQTAENTRTENLVSENISQDKAVEKPNIIFVLADDLAVGDLGCFGQKKIQTPNLDRLCAEGVRFTQGYSGASVCAPSRATLITGLSTGHCPIRANYEYQGEGQLELPTETYTVAQHLKSAGYATGCFGKWGMGMFETTGSPLKKGFDRFFGYNCQRHAHTYFTDHLYDNDQRIELDGKTYSANLIQKKTMEWLEENKDGPFFLFYATTLPHTPLVVDDLGIYADENLTKNWTDNQKKYAAMVSKLDTQVGEIADWLKKNNLDEKTLIIFSGDNGGEYAPGSEMDVFFDQMKGFRGHKRSVYEGGLRNACFARWSKHIAPQSVCDIPWFFPDFLPTCAELSGVPLPNNVPTDGLSVVDLFLNGNAPKRTAFYWELFEGPFIQAVRFDDWKVVKNGLKAPTEVYDLSVDPGEKNDLAKDHPEIVQKGESLLKSMRTESRIWKTN